MKQVTGLTANPFQQTTVVLDDGTKLVLQMYFRAQQYGWFFTLLNWNNGQWLERGRRIVNSGNMLNQYRNIIPFGIACFTTADREPTQVQDFQSGTSKLYTLTAAEVTAYANFIKGQKK